MPHRDRFRLSPDLHNLWVMLGLIVLAFYAGHGRPCFASGWYVGNTAPTEWIEYKQVYLTAGSYRFTARAGSPVAGTTFHVEVDGVAVRSGVAIPNTGRADSFTYVHLGHKTLTQGYHSLKIVFETANGSLDWFMLTKDTDTSTSVKAADYTMLRPDTSGMLIAPVVGFEHKTGTRGWPSNLCSIPEKDRNGNPYTDAQLSSWYSVPMYQDYDRRTDRYWDILVEELLASRAQVPLFHCRSTKDFTHGLQDRDYAEGGGAYEGRWLLKFSEAVARNPQAASALKVGMFWENAGIAEGFQSLYGYYPGWGDPALVDYVMDYWLSPWFDNIPASLLYMPIPSRPVISIYTSNPAHIVKDGRIGDYMAALRSRLQSKYGYDPLFLTGGGYDGATVTKLWGQAPWVTWDGPLLENYQFEGEPWGTAMCGSRRRLDTVWLNDWNPSTNTGTPTPIDPSNSPGRDSFQSRLDSNGNSVLLGALAQAEAMGMVLVREEGFTNIAEGNSIFRSYHPGWAFPNQHLAAMREYADPTTQTLKFEAEGCDDYYKVALNGNTGGSYRREWYSGVNNLDVYRPLHNLQGWIPKHTGPGNLIQISAGFYDAWALGADGKVWAQHIMGAPNTWTQVTSAPAALTRISVGKGYVWALKGSTVYSAAIPYGWAHSSATGWAQRSGSMSEISAGTTEVWGVNASGQVFRRPADATGDWVQVTGTMDSVALGDNFAWGIRGSNIYFTPTASVSWTQVSNPNNIIKLAVGSEEVWGVNASGQLFRRSFSGVGEWDAVNNPGGTLTSLAVGEGYFWGLVGATPLTRRLEGFQGMEPLPPQPPRATAGTSQVGLTWTAVSGATGYNVKRATSSAGPYTTIASNILPWTTTLNYTDSSVVNGTTYFYMVSALTSAGETANSVAVSARPQSVVPTAPSNLALVPSLNYSTKLTWKDNSNNESGFIIERKTGVASTYAQVGVATANATSYTDAIASGTDYFYRVCARNAAGDSTYSNETAFTTSNYRLDRTGWVASASVSGGGAASNALDGNLTTRWATGSVGQVPGHWFQVDMGKINTVYQVRLDIVNNDYPIVYQAYLSLDGINWGEPVANAAGCSPLTEILFDPQDARYIRLVTTRKGGWWSIYEFNVYGLPSENLNRTGWTFSASALPGSASNAGDGNLSTRWSTGGSQANGQWFMADMGAPSLVGQIILDQGSSSNDFPRGYNVNISNDGINWGVPVATGTGTTGFTAIDLLPHTARYLRITQTGSTNGIFWSIHEFQPTGSPVQALSRLGWVASSFGGTSAAFAIDGTLSTRWTTSANQANGQWFQVDMGASNTFHQIVLDAGSSINDYPRAYQVFVSADGVNWGNSIATGYQSATISTIIFPQQTARYIRIVQTGNTGPYWSIHEFNAYN